MAAAAAMRSAEARASEGPGIGPRRPRDVSGVPMTEPDVRSLYRGDPEGFVAARDALAKRLRDEGRDADAAEVKKLRRPTVAAWALDRLADDAPDAIRELPDAGA